MNIAIDLPDEAEEQVISFMVKFKGDDKPVKPFHRQLGVLKNDDFYMAPDFDTCFEDNPSEFGLEEYM